MPQVWDADVEVSQDRCAELIRTQFPELKARDIKLVGEGYDNSAYLVDQKWLFRFPRRKIAESLLRNECAALSILAPQLPLSVPKPRFIGKPADGYPYPFAGYEFLPGRSASLAEWTEEDRAKNARTLAKFFAALHSIPVSDQTRKWAPADEISRSDLTKRFAMIEERLSVSSAMFAQFDVRHILSTAERLARSGPWEKDTVWVHGDAYAAHFLVDDSLNITGVIDWGDCHLGDPALDLSVAFGFLPPSARETFREAYGGVDDATWDRARFRAIFYGVVLTYYACETANEPFRLVAEYALHSAWQ